MVLPELLLHADWSLHPKKRWVAWATRENDGYLLRGIEPVEDPTTLLQRLRLRSGVTGSAMLGFDFPLGLPEGYARRAGIDSFLAWFRHEWRETPWLEFAQVCERQEEIHIHRPFYPRRPGGTKQQHLVDGLGVSGMNELFRRCDRATVHRQRAASLFWTLGGNQVGKAALTGWRDWLYPLLRSEENVSVWPFEGSLETLLAREGVLLTEAYPGEYAISLGSLLAGGSKRRSSDRQRAGHPLNEWCQKTGLRLQREEEARLLDGFGPKPEGEDPFDAFLGLCGLWQVLCGERTSGEPVGEPWLAQEGWVLGLQASELKSPL